MNSAITVRQLHAWTLTPAEAIAVQERLRRDVTVSELTTPVEWLAAVDTGFIDGGRTALAAAVLFHLPSMEAVEEHLAHAPVTFPYVPGLLSFRELPAVLAAAVQLSRRPDLILCDGQGIAHPRRLGIASHLGLLLDLPTIGVGKSRLVGRHKEPGPAKGNWTELCHHGERIGSVVRTRTGVKPLYISPGHRVSHEQAIDWVLRTTGRYRLPEPIRAADRLASRRGKSKPPPQAFRELPQA